MAFLVPSLVRARAAIDRRWYTRDRRSDGWIGDEAHQARVSDHNPDSAGRVHAIDVDTDGIHVPTVLAAFIAATPSHYVIHARRIWQKEDQWRPRVYTGNNPHDGHIHESIEHSDFARLWVGDWEPIERWNPGTLPALAAGSHGYHVRILQAYLNGHWSALAVDAVFGPKTEKALRAFQTRARITVDGICGPQTIRALSTIG